MTSWQVDGGKVEKVTDFIFLDFKITVDGDCNHEIKRHLLLERKAMMNLDSILKSRDITLTTKGHIVKAMFFPAVMYGSESWTIKKAEQGSICCSVTQSCPAVCDFMDCSMSDFPVFHHFPELTQTHVH